MESDNDKQEFSFMAKNLGGLVCALSDTDFELSINFAERAKLPEIYRGQAYDANTAQVTISGCCGDEQKKLILNKFEIQNGELCVE